MKQDIKDPVCSKAVEMDFFENMKENGSIDGYYQLHVFLRCRIG
jgi:hypothetical protein